MFEQLDLPLEDPEATTPVATDDRPCYLWLKQPWTPAAYPDQQD